MQPILSKSTHKEPGYKTQTERQYALHLHLLFQAGKIKRYDYQPEKLIVGDYLIYSPNFRVITQDDIVEFHDVKSFWRSDSKSMIKMAASCHPYRFVAVSKSKSGWTYESY
jgi:hypothetical protein